ncbi:hypothetical protein M501DRAFT_1028033 [Patellaria atrata CBS 101060]|uniref:BTB domain-containing protein n=1 Tax=Patellaria atrata CBS 101060 TaxID=1346257 RepID=A0A9P4SHT8_9PEZI|nr:hypothetical protein M501DRAFT_1028033 [Patellaria atrata CBS 101060]
MAMEINRPDSRFPNYRDGDVRIILSNTRKFQLHSDTLRNSCNLFRKLLTEDRAAPLSTKAKKDGVVVRYRLHMTERPPDDNDGNANTGRLQLVELDSNGKIASKNTSVGVLTENDNGKVPNALFGYYHNVFAAIYNQELNIASEDIASVLTQCVGILDIAEYLGCVSAVAKIIDVAIISHGQILYRSIADKPIPWLLLSTRIKSDVIFKESMIHIVGQWNMLDADEKLAMPEDLHNRCWNKRLNVINFCRDYEAGLFGVYATSMRREAAVEDISRSSYGGDIYLWQACDIFKRYLGEALIGREEGWVCEDGGYMLYSRLSKGGQNYLTRAELEVFHRDFPMSNKGRGSLDNTLLKIKDRVRVFTANKGVLKNNSALDVDKFRIEYLTCAEVKREDVPWQGTIG